MGRRRQPLVWLMLGNRLGDNNQLFALADALGLPFETKQLTYNQLRKIRFLRGPRLLSLTAEARELIKPPWPDLIIGIGYGSVPIARYVREQAGGRTRLVQIGNPRTSIADLDLVITTPQYARRKPAPNVLSLPFPIGNPAEALTPSEDEERWLSRLPAPRRLIAVGGIAHNWRVDDDALVHAVEKVRQRVQQDGGSLIVATSPRTDKRTIARLARTLAGERELLVHQFPRFGVLLANADEIFVTADSVSMLSEAILTGKPVGMIRVRKSGRGWVSYWLADHGLKPQPYPNLPNFWRVLDDHALVGTVDAPRASAVNDTTAIAVGAVRRLLDG
jgi:mitochondrial fission protein ELM1